jgi:hypothetical protein
MSNRFHNKYHRHNHHSYTIDDVRYPDAGHDPIASYDSPFLGEFVMHGTLSATATPGFSDVEGLPAGSFSGEEIGLKATAPSTGIAALIDGNLKVLGDLSASNVFLEGVTEVNPGEATTTGRFLVVNINSVPYGIRLWNLS